MLGAGDIKLMAVCVGFLGVQNGLLVMGCGLGLAVLWAFGKFLKTGLFWGQQLRLAPHLFGGYCLCLPLLCR